MSVATFSELDDSLDYFYENEAVEATTGDIFEHCVLPSAASIFHVLYKIILVNLIFGISVSVVRLPFAVYHLLSGISGLYLLNGLESFEGKIVIVVYFIISYLLLFLIYNVQAYFDLSKKYNIKKLRYLSSANIVKYFLIIILVSCEYFLLETETWMEIRGIIMIFTMKIISLSEDVDKCVIPFPLIFDYFGYILCGANVMFGPWISFQEYLLIFQQPTKKNMWWILAIIRALATSLFFLMISNCWAQYLIDDEANIWFVSYRDALSFRTSHYFVSFLSETSMLCAGFKNQKIWNDPQKWRFEIVNPLKVEFPSALAVVVTTWNKPMHEFLKKYIYRSWLPMGKFYGILATFIISSFLHGFELKVSVVLILLGFFSYLQFAARDYFAKAFNSCIRVYPCKEGCSHAFKRNSIISIGSRLFFSFTSIIHLIYLGIIMDPSTDEIGIIEKWKNLYFISFWIMVVNVLLIM